MENQEPHREQEHRLLGRLGVGVIAADGAGRVEYLSPFAQQVTGWTADDAQGRPLDEVFRLVAAEAIPIPGRAAQQPAASALGAERATLLARDGGRHAVEFVVSTERAGNGRQQQLLVLFSDVSEFALASLQLARASTLDVLTGLLNRQTFSQAVERLLREHPAGRGLLAVVQVDLDQFNLVNNTCGHGAGNDLLEWVAAMLREESRPADVVARLGGDVFALVLRVGNEEEARTLAEGVRCRLQQFQFTWEDRSFTITASLGLVLVGGGPAGIREVLSAADHACNQAKRLGRNQVYTCNLEDEEVIRRERELDWVARIKANLVANRVTLFAQPILPLRREARRGLYFEVLLRLTAGDTTPASAAREIRAAEKYGLMGLVDRWVITHALSQLAVLPRATLARVHLCSINISGTSLHDRSILEHIHRELDRHRLAPSMFCFELTETAAVDSLPQARWLMEELLAIGCRMALDDFGSGLASYGYLKELPVSFLKIAGDFVENISGEPLNRAMVESIHQVARVLDLQSIAESVAGPDGLDAVREIGVDFAQGHFVGVPRPLQQLLTEV